MNSEIKLMKIRVLKNILRVENEKHAGFSALKALFNLAHDRDNALESVSEGFLCEFFFLFLGIQGKSFKRLASENSFGDLHGREAALVRSKQLNEYSSDMGNYFKKYRKGTDAILVRRVRPSNTWDLVRPW